MIEITQYKLYEDQEYLYTLERNQELLLNFKRWE